MPADTTNVLGKSPLLTKSLAKSLLSQSVRRVMIRFDGSEADLGESIGTTGQTINNAINQNSLIELHTAFNLMLVDPFVMDTLLNYHGRRSVPIAAKCDTDALVTTSAAVHKLAEAQSRNGKITDSECLNIEDAIDGALDSLAAIKNRCIAIRAGRAAA